MVDAYTLLRHIPRIPESEVVDVDAPELDRTLESIPRPDSDDELLLEEEYSAPSRKYEFRLRKVKSYNEELDEEEEFEELVLEEVSDGDEHSDSSISEISSGDNASEFEDEDEDGLSDEDLASARRSKNRKSIRKSLASDHSDDHSDIGDNVDQDTPVFGGMNEASSTHSPTLLAKSSITDAPALPAHTDMPFTDRLPSSSTVPATQKAKAVMEPSSSVQKLSHASLDQHDIVPLPHLPSGLPERHPNSLVRERTPTQQAVTNYRTSLPFIADQVKVGSTHEEEEPIVEVSSSNFEAAARAAEILRLHHDYIQHAAPVEGYQRAGSIPRALSRHSNRGSSVSLRDPDADLRTGQSNTPFRFSAGTAQAGATTSAVKTGKAVNNSAQTSHSWNSNDWAVLSRCYEICCQDVDDPEFVDFDSVISQFLDETDDTRFSREDVLKRVVALQGRGSKWSRQGSKRPRSGSVSSIGSRASFGMMPPRLHPQIGTESPSLTSGRQRNSISIQGDTKRRRLSSVQPEAPVEGLVRRLSALFSGSSPKPSMDADATKPNFIVPKPKASTHTNANSSSIASMNRAQEPPQAGIYPSVPSYRAPQASTSKDNKSAKGLSRLIPWR